MKKRRLDKDKPEDSSRSDEDDQDHVRYMSKVERVSVEGMKGKGIAQDDNGDKPVD